MCKCIELTDEALAGTNTALDIPQRFNFQTGKFLPARMLIATRKRDSKKRERVQSIIANYCPTCGEKYEDGDD